MVFLLKLTHLFRFVKKNNNNSFPLVRYLQNLFLKQFCVYIDFVSFLFMKDSSFFHSLFYNMSMFVYNSEKLIYHLVISDVGFQSLKEKKVFFHVEQKLSFIKSFVIPVPYSNELSEIQKTL